MVSGTITDSAYTRFHHSPSSPPNKNSIDFFVLDHILEVTDVWTTDCFQTLDLLRNATAGQK